MDGQAGKLSDAAVHLIDYAGGAPGGCLRSRCGVILGDHNPRLTDEVIEATCAKCVAGLAEWRKAQKDPAHEDRCFFEAVGEAAS